MKLTLVFLAALSATAQTTVTVDFGSLGKATVPTSYQLSLERERLSTVTGSGRLAGDMAADATSIRIADVNIAAYPVAIIVGNEVMTLTAEGVVQRGTMAESIIPSRRTAVVHRFGEPVLVLKYTTRLDIFRHAILEKLQSVLDSYPTPEMLAAAEEEEAARRKRESEKTKVVIE